MKFLSLTINGFDVRVAFDENSVHIYNAYPIKDDLKLRGYRWNSEQKTWYNDRNDVETELKVLKNELKPNLNKPSVDISNQLKSENTAFEIKKSSSVSELKSRINRAISESVGGNIWVRGIISSDLKNYQWASYFDLRDEDQKQDIFFSSEIKANVLSSVNYKLNKSKIADSLSKDLPVLLLVNVSLSYKKNIDIRLNIIDILPEFTREKIKNQREITIDRLRSEGLFENQKRLTLPKLIRRIGLISSEQGTSVQDILSGIGIYKDKYNIYFIDARMEGDNAVDSVIKGIEYFEKQKDPVDALIIARGGGSEQSLSVFNDYKICNKICNTKIPVLTAIGHDKDISAVELCSFLTPSPSTPSGVGKFFFDRYYEAEIELLNLFRKISDLSASFLNDHLYKVKNNINSISVINRRFIINNFSKISDRIKYLFIRVKSKNQSEKQKIAVMNNKVEPDKIFHAISEKKNKVKQNLSYIFNSGNRILKNTENFLKQMNIIINANDPENVLKKGFSLTVNNKGKIIVSKENFIEKKAVIRFYDGEVKIKKNEDEDE